MAGYRAFFSYARADVRIAGWLHRQLDGYRTPKPLIGADGALGPVPPKLHPIFRDRTDLQAGGRIDQSLQEALESSECLVVLCTPTSAKSFWVNHECETFLKLGRADRIFPVIADGEPDSGLAETECFPPALRGAGLLAADLRELKKSNGQLVGDGRYAGRLKLIAGLLGVPLDALTKREQQRQRNLVAQLSSALALFIAVALLAVWQTVEANKQREIAVEQARRVELSLLQFYAERSRQRAALGEYDQARRYALAGAVLAPEQLELYRQALGEAALGSLEPAATLPMPAAEHGTTALSDDGQRFIIADGSRVSVWDVRSGKVAVAFDAGAEVSWLQPSPNGAWLIIHHEGRGNPAIWDVRETAQRVPIEPNVDWFVANFFADAVHLITSSLNAPRILEVKRSENGGYRLSYLRLRNDWTGAPIAAQYIGAFGASYLTANGQWWRVPWPTGQAEAGAQTPQGLATLRILPQGASLSVLRRQAPYEEVATATFSAEGLGQVSDAQLSSNGRVVLLHADGGTFVWSLNEKFEQPALITKISADAGSPQLSQDGQRVTVQRWGGETSVWSTRDGSRLLRLRNDAPSWLSGSAAGGRRIVTGTSAGLRITDLSVLFAPWAELAPNACRGLSDGGRRFNNVEMEVDPLLRETWSRDRDVCERVPGIEALPRRIYAPEQSPWLSTR